MKKLLLALLMLGGIQQSSMAANGDTTWVQGHSGLQMDNYNNFDAPVTFPDGSKDYRKVFMHFNLGKYVCPNNPQYCGDWDYDVHTYVMTPTDTFELGRLITPYAHTGFGRFTATWTHDYVFDVSDYQDYLKDNATLRILYSGYSGGFTADVKFAFIEGTPERNVLRIDRTWNGGFDYGHGTPINTALTTLNFTPPTGTESTVFQSWITGHGGDDQGGCAEFCPNHYNLSLNGTSFLTQDFWREDCSDNNIYPQSGTWVYNRANWCPGDLVHSFYHKLNGVSAGTAYTMNMTFPTYTSTATQGNSPASYKLDGGVIYYAGYNKTVDATLEDIISPTNAEVHFRQNPLLGSPKVSVRNSGGTALTSLKFEYGIVGKSTQTYTWNGSIASSETATITFPELEELKLASGTYEFMVKITEANGAADGDNSNDMLHSTFTAAPVWPTDFRIELSNKNGGETKWRVEKLDGTVMAEKSNCGVDALCKDTVHVDFGAAYRLIVGDTFSNNYLNIPTGGGLASLSGDGLNFFTNDPGYFRVYPIGSTTQIPVPANFSGDFGFGYVHYFYTGFPTSVHQVNNNATISVYPNPSTGKFTLDYAFKGAAVNNASYTVSDVTGKTIIAGALNASATQQVIDMTGKPVGIYVLQVRAEGLSWTQKVILK